MKNTPGIWVNKDRDGITYTRGTFTYNDDGKNRRRWAFVSRFTNSTFTLFYNSMKEAKAEGWRKV